MTTSIDNSKLLVVDTSTAMLHVLKNFVGKHGYEADHVADPVEACRHLDQRFQDFSSDYRCVILGWPEGKLDLIGELLEKLSATDHGSLPLIIICQEVNAEVKALLKRRPRTRALLWTEYQQASDFIDRLSSRAGRVVPEQNVAVAAERTSKSVQTSRVQTVGMQHSFSVLLVDTAPSVCERLRDLMESNDYRVSVVGTAAEARQLLADQTFDLVVTDFFLRGDSGEALCQSLQTSGSEIKPVCVVLTAKYSDSIVQRSLAVGATACLYKNESTELLFARINALTHSFHRKQVAVGEESAVVTARAGAVGESSGQRAAGRRIVTRTRTVPVARSDSASGNGRTSTVKLGEQLRKERKTVVVPARTDHVSGKEKSADLAVSQNANQEANPHANPHANRDVKAGAEGVGGELASKVSMEGSAIDQETSVEKILDQLKLRKSSAQHSVLMLDVEIVAATGDRLSLGDSGPMRDLVAKSLRNLYPKEQAQACTKEGKFVLLLKTLKFQDALVLTRKIMQLVPRMVPYLNNMSLVSHAAILRVDHDAVVDHSSIIERCEAACKKIQMDARDNTALVLPHNKYLSSVIPNSTDKVKKETV